MSIQSLNQMLDGLTVTDDSVADEMVIASPFHPETYIVFRSDGILEIRAGAAVIALDANTGAIVVKGSMMKTRMTHTRMHTGTFGIGTDLLNPEYLSNPGGNHVIPSMMKNPAFGEVVVGVPNEGQRNVKLSDLFSQHDVFLGQDGSKRGTQLCEGLDKILG